MVKVEWYERDGSISFKEFNTMAQAIKFQEKLVFTYGIDAEIQ